MRKGKFIVIHPPSSIVQWLSSSTCSHLLYNYFCTTFSLFVFGSAVNEPLIEVLPDSARLVFCVEAQSELMKFKHKS